MENKYLVQAVLDTDNGEKEVELEVVVPFDADDSYEIENYISDAISNQTGFCHLGFTYELKK